MSYVKFDYIVKEGCTNAMLSIMLLGMFLTKKADTYIVWPLCVLALYRIVWFVYVLWKWDDTQWVAEAKRKQNMTKEKLKAFNRGYDYT